jgi:hypothetical protein
MRALAAAVLAAAACAASARALEPTARQAKLDEIHSFLDYGLWNGRIEALYDLGELGRDGLPLLSYADDDADWQVRLTAVHFLGKVGLPAAPALGEVALREPCPHVRLYALEWLSRMGATGEQYYREAITPEDEAALGRLPPRHDPAFMGKPLVIDAPDEMNAEFFNGGADLRVCASSEHAGRQHSHRERPQDADAEAAAHEVVVTADVPAWARGGRSSSTTAAGGRPGPPESLPPGTAASEVAGVPRAAPKTPEQKRRDAELDVLLAPGRPESLPPGAPAPAARDSEPPRTDFESPGARATASSSVRAVSSGTRESFPAGAPAPEPRALEPAAAAFVADAGTGKPEQDPIPGLIERLSDSDPHRRARAADELGKRGLAAAKAVPALCRALTDRDRRVRASAVLALGSAGAGAEAVASDLRRALRDQDEDVRFSAGIALERFRRLGGEPR